MLAFTKVGLMPDGGATALLAGSVGRSKALRMALTAERLTAVEALAAGLLYSVADDETFDHQVLALVQALAVGPTGPTRRRSGQSTMRPYRSSRHRWRANGGGSPLSW